MIEKVRIFEKDLPVGIPEDIGENSLEVVNAKGETVALFIYPDIVEERFSNPLDFIKSYDKIFDFGSIIDDIQLNYEGNEAGGFEAGELSLEWARLGSEIDRQITDTFITGDFFEGFDWPDDWILPKRFKIMALARMAYPYHLHSRILLENIYNNVNQPVSLLDDISEYDDSRLIAMWIYQRFNSLPGLYEAGYINYVYEYPEMFISQRNIDSSINEAIDANITELTAFLLDYKNQHFQADGNASTSNAL